jgi:hypothetical protein
MWEPRPLTTLWASTTCYRDKFTFLPYFRDRLTTVEKYYLMKLNKSDLEVRMTIENLAAVWNYSLQKLARF